VSALIITIHPSLGVASRYVGTKSKAPALQKNEIMNGIKYMICKWDLQARTLVSNYDVGEAYAERGGSLRRAGRKAESLL
jgi:hypothetical protein